MYPSPSACCPTPSRTAVRDLLARYREATGPRGVPGSPAPRGPYPARVYTECGRELPALLLHDPALSWVRLIAASSLLGHKARVLVPRPGGGKRVAWEVRVL